MRRGPKPAKFKEAQPPVARKSPKNPASRVRDLEKRLAGAVGQLQTRDRELAEARGQLTAAHTEVGESHEQQTATADILRVISSSPTDVQPVFAAAVANAARLCSALDAAIHLVSGDALHLAAHEGPIAPDPVLLLTEGTLAGRVIRQRQAMHVADMQAETLEYPMSSEFARNRGFRTILSAPLLRGAEAIGTITIRRTEVRPFTDRQIALLKTFANQAVIAIENVRLFNETKEALDRQTATSEVLSVISTSPTDVQPVFDAIARHAVALCSGVGGIVVRYDGTVMRLAAYHNVSATSRERHETEYPRTPDRTVPLGAAIVDRMIVHVPNLQASTRFAGSPVQRSGRGSMIAVPLLCHGEAIGAIGITRDTPQGFSDRDITLLQTFADQAVIAIENVRLFNEPRRPWSSRRPRAKSYGLSASPRQTYNRCLTRSSRAPLSCAMGFSVHSIASTAN